ncbi:MAG: cytochrome C [Chitinophagaceae bacterium]|nr:cytochrome C [Chitinophagaceae bacterium]
MHHFFRQIILPIFCVIFFACNQNDALPPPARPSKINPNPSSAFLSPEESMKTIKLPPGFHLELVASEPIIQEPVAIVWDANGNMYVAEMRSYMQDIVGTGERLPICRITKLEDTDGDGKMDKHTVFIDSLVLPRMMLALDDRLVVNETYTYNLYSYKDKNDDGKADEKTLVYHNNTLDDANLEHQKTGLVWNIDNWIYVTSNPVRYRFVNGMMKVDTLSGSPGGQWGLAHDNYGRLFFSTAGGEKAAQNFQENPLYGDLDFGDQREGDFDEVWPIVATPDIEGGQHRLREDSTLNHFTGCCGQSIFRGDRLPKTMLGDLFVCEPVGRLIRRAKVTERQGITYVKNAYDKREFIASTDLNFRPINTATGPDGCLYIVDMYHGIIQESEWTKPDSYINPQILRKKLDKNINRGRIYRLVHDGFKPGPKPQMLKASNDDLIGYLSHPNGWWRDNAQRLLVIHGDKSVVPELKRIALNQKTITEKLTFWKSVPTPLARLHALWTLEGLNALDEKTISTALQDNDIEIKKAAIRMSEPMLVSNNPKMLSQLIKMKSDTSYGVKIQLALSLRFSKTDIAIATLKEIKSANDSNKLIAKAVSRSLLRTDETLAALRESTNGLGEKDKDLVYDGSINYQQLCATCHGKEGEGIPSQLAPPLAGSARVNGDKDILINILLAGLKGPIDNHVYPEQMPSQKEHTDVYIASVLSYMRRSFGNKGEIVKPGNVRDIRKLLNGRDSAWTLAALKDWKKPEKK